MNPIEQLWAAIKNSGDSSGYKAFLSYKRRLQASK
jgi:transposase